MQIKSTGQTNSILTFYELTEGGDLVHTTGSSFFPPSLSLLLSAPYFVPFPTPRSISSRPALLTFAFFPPSQQISTKSPTPCSGKPSTYSSSKARRRCSKASERKGTESSSSEGAVELKVKGNVVLLYRLFFFPSPLLRRSFAARRGRRKRGQQGDLRENGRREDNYKQERKADEGE